MWRLFCYIFCSHPSIQFNSISLTQPPGPTPMVLPVKNKARQAYWGTTLPGDRRATGAITPLNHQRIKYTHSHCWRQTLKIRAAIVQGHSKRCPLHGQNQSSPWVTGTPKIQTGPAYMLWELQFLCHGSTACSLQLAVCSLQLAVCTRFVGCEVQWQQR